MSKFVQFTIVLLAMHFIVGCVKTQTPYPATYKYTTQKKMQAAEHWNILAQDVARQIKIGLVETNSITRSVFVEPACGSPQGPCDPHDETPFGEGFHDMLLTHLVKLGVKTMAEIDEDALIVTTKSQVLYHRESRLTRAAPPGIMTVAATLLTGAILVIRDAIDYGETTDVTAAWAGAGLATVALYDVTSGMFTKGIPHSEVIITTSINENNIYLMRKTDIYYINDTDYWHYKVAPKPVTIEITAK